MITYSASGARVATVASAGDSIVSSTDGSTILLYFASAQDTTPITLIRNGVSRTIAVPGPVPYGIALSPDGSGVVITCQVDDKVLGEVQEALLLVG
jgi:DNA-binding beta-propeller fold protein YncE